VIGAAVHRNPVQAGPPPRAAPLRVLSSTALALAVCAACAGTARERAPPAVPAAAPAAWIDPFPVPAEGLHLAAGATLSDLIREYGRVTDELVLVPHDTQMQIARRDESFAERLPGPIDVPPEAVHGFVEGVLWNEQCMIVDPSEAVPRMIAIRSLETQERNLVGAEAPYAPVEHVEAWRDHPARLVRTVVALPDTDCYLLEGDLRSLRGGDFFRIVPAGQHTVVVAGTGRQVAQAVPLLRKIGAQHTEALQALQSALDEPTVFRTIPGNEEE
jgi:hypothetical protein